MEMVFHPEKNLVEFLRCPAAISPEIEKKATTIAMRILNQLHLIGVLAVEMFVTKAGDVLVNEIAPRVHNSGHVTIEACQTSQFENHVRAVLDLPLGPTAPQHLQVASVNVFGGAAGEDPAQLLARGLAVEGAHVHLYGKSARPGRKLGHVTVCGDEADVVRSRAWSAALALGTPVPDGIDLPAGVLP